MLTKSEIRKYLEQNPYWEPSDEASDDEWSLYQEVKEELLEEEGNEKSNDNYDDDDYYDDDDDDDDDDEF